MTKKKLSKLGRYRILGELGRGAMGVVYKAEDPALDRIVALKTIALAEDAEGRTEFEARFEREAKSAGRLNHPHIITIYDFGQEDDLAYMAMELLDGTELRDKMAAGAIPIREAIDIAAQVAEGLAYAHEHGVVHRDIKPSNIMLMPRGLVKIMDFGIARTRTSDHRTSTGVVLGTPKYMSPEQVAGLPVDHRSDIFSLGIVLYEMLTRTSLFLGEDMPQILYNVAHAEQTPPSRLNSEVPPVLDFAVTRALKKDPEVRYQNAQEFAADLRACLSELGDAPTSGKAERQTDLTKTTKLDSDPGKNAAKNLRTPAGAMGTDTRLPLSQRFDSSRALDRLAEPSRKDLALFARQPKPVGILRRFKNDPSQRLLLLVSVAAMLIGGIIAFY